MSFLVLESNAGSMQGRERNVHKCKDNICSRRSSFFFFFYCKWDGGSLLASPLRMPLTGTEHGRGDTTVKTPGDTFLAQNGAVGMEHVVILWWIDGWLTLQTGLDGIDTIKNKTMVYAG